MRRKSRRLRRFDLANRDYVDRNIKLIATWSLFFPFLTALIGITFVILLGKGGRDVIDHRFTVGTMWAFYWFLGQLVFPMIALGWVTNIFQRGAASMGRLNYILHAKPRIGDFTSANQERAGNRAGPDGAIGRNGDSAQAGGAVESSIRGEIEFRHLTFTYPTARNERWDWRRPGAARHQFARAGGFDSGDRWADGKRQIHAGCADCAVVGSAAGNFVFGWAFDSRLSAGGSAARDRVRAAGYFSFQRYAARKHRVWREQRAGRAYFRGGGDRQYFRRDTELPTALRHDGGRARHYAFGRAEAADVHRARGSAPAEDFDPG